MNLGTKKYGEASWLRTLKSGREYEALFTKAPGEVHTIKKNAQLSDTLVFIPQIIPKIIDQTTKIAQRLKRGNVYDTCKRIWHFVYEHIQYRKDENGYEQIRSPRRTWHDRFAGVDCDCYSVFISSILTNLGIPHILRITKYSEDYFQHIYPVVPFNGRFIIIDCVTDRFDYEVPFSEKKDYPMELQFLDGIPSQKIYAGANDPSNEGIYDGTEELNRILARNLNGSDTYDGLFGRKKKKAAAANPGNPAAPAPKKKKKKGLLKKLANVVNKVNPATVLLRNGILAAMKLNMFKVGSDLRWSYLTPEQARAKGTIDMDKYAKYVKAREKLENAFYAAGGKPENLRKAILKGKANKDKGVPLNGVDGLGSLDFVGDYMDSSTPLSQLLGPDIFYSENELSINGLGELGEPATGAAIAAATGLIAAIAKMLKGIGGVFKKGQEPAGTVADENVPPVAPSNAALPESSIPSTATNPIVPSGFATPQPEADYSAYQNSNPATTSSSERSSPEESEENENEMNSIVPQTQLPVANKTATASNNDSTDKEGFWEKNKTWLKPTLIGVGGLTVIFLGVKLVGSKNKSSPVHGLSGIPHHKRKKKHHRKTKSKKHHRKTPVALL